MSHILPRIFGSATPIIFSLAPIEEPLKIISLLVGIAAGFLTISDVLKKWKNK